MKGWIVLRRIFGFVLAVAVTGTACAGMELVLEADRQSYLLGEPVSVILKAENNSCADVVTSVVLAPTVGMIQLLIAKNGEEFRQYRGPGWGTRDVYRPPAPVEPGASFEQPFKLLWHNQLPGDERFLARQFAFESAGCYTLKAIPLLQNFDSESNSIEICLTDPTGQDLRFWEILKAEPELAMFIQRPIIEVSSSVLVQVQELMRQFASSTYGPYLKQAIRERREFEAQGGR